jgi:hypothetical protein
MDLLDWKHSSIGNWLFLQMKLDDQICIQGNFEIIIKLHCNSEQLDETGLQATVANKNTNIQF